MIKNIVFCTGFLFSLLLIFTRVYSDEFDLPSVRSNFIVAMQAMQNENDSLTESTLKWILSVPGIRKQKNGRYYLKSSYYLGRFYFGRQNWTAADKYFSAVLSFKGSKSGIPQTLYYLGRTRLAMGKYLEGLSFLNQYRAKYGNRDKLEPEVLFWSAFAYAKLEDFLLADRLLSELERRYAYSQANFSARDLKQEVRSKLQEEQNIKLAYTTVSNQVTLQSNQIRVLSNQNLVLSNKLQKELQREEWLKIILRMQNTLRSLADLKAAQVEELNQLKNSEGNNEIH